MYYFSLELPKDQVARKWHYVEKNLHVAVKMILNLRNAVITGQNVGA